MSSISADKLAGVYYLHSIRETASGFKLNPDGTFQFFFTYGALDRHGFGKWALVNDHVVLQSRSWSGSDFVLTSSSASGRGITVKIGDNNPQFRSHVFASLKNGEDGSWQAPDARGEIHFPVDDANVITLAFEFCPERFTFFTIVNKEHNYFEFRAEPSIMEVFFNNFQLKPKRHVLIGKHPLLKGEEFIYERS